MITILQFGGGSWQIGLILPDGQYLGSWSYGPRLHVKSCFLRILWSIIRLMCVFAIYAYFCSNGRKITILHRGGRPKWLQYYIGGGTPKRLQYYIGRGGSSKTPKSDYVIYGWPLIGMHVLTVAQRQKHVALPSFGGSNPKVFIMKIY